MRVRLTALMLLFAVVIASRHASATHIRVFMQGGVTATATASPTPTPRGVRPTATSTSAPRILPSLPGVFEAELCDATEGVGYHDVDAVNSGGAFRPSEGVDIAATSGGGYHVTSAVAGEWLSYTTSVWATGPMILQVRVASSSAGGTFHIELDGANLTGPLTVPDTGGGESWYTITRAVTVSTSSASSKVRLVMDSNGASGVVGSFNYFTFTQALSTATPTATPTSTAGLTIVRVPSAYTWIPGTFEVEDFEPIHEDTGYFDTDAANRGGAYRPSEGVDIEATSDVGGGYDVGWTKKTEWMEYCWGNVPIDGHYVLRVRVASVGPGGVFHLEVGGVDVTGPVTVPDTGGPQTWQTLERRVALTRGTWRLRLVIDGDGPAGSAGSFNSVSFDPADDTGPVPPPLPTATYTPTPTNTPTPTSTSTPTSTVPPRVGAPILLSQGKVALASSVENANTTADKAVDGNLGTRWSSAFGDPQWIRVDLGAAASISRVVLAWEAAYAKAYQIQTSDDGASWTTLYSRTTGSGGTHDLSVNGTGRYVRMFGTARATAYGYSLWEALKVYGAPLVSQGRPVAASSVENGGTLAAKAVDGSTGTRWSSAFADPQWIAVDLGAPYALTRVALRWEAAYAKAYRIETSPDAVAWTSIFSTTSGDGGTDDLQVAGSGRYVRMYGTTRATSYGYSLWELQVFGTN